MNAHETNNETALKFLTEALGKNGVAIGAVQIGNRSCVAIFIQDYAGKRYGAIRQLLFGLPGKGPTLTKKGLNATREEWIRVANVLKNAETMDLSGDEFFELLRLPVDDDKNAIQVYCHNLLDETRFVIGKIFNYKTYGGKCGGASFNISELARVIDGIDTMITELHDEDVIVPPVGIKRSTGILEVEDDFSHLF